MWIVINPFRCDYNLNAIGLDGTKNAFPAQMFAAEIVYVAEDSRFR